MIKKTLLTTLLILGCLWGAGELRAYDFSAENANEQTIYYNYVSSQLGTEVIVTYKDSKYNTYSGNIIIPSTVINPNNSKEYYVKRIDNNAFRACTGLTSISIPEGITTIGNYAFYGCNNSSFTSITLPSTVTTIGSTGTGNSDGRVFYNCTYLQSINIPSGVAYIPFYAFYGCSSLSSIEIPSSVTSIGQYAFYNCAALSSVNIPSGITNIEQYTFRGCSTITSILLPASITAIGSNAFYMCTNLASVTLLGTAQPTLSSPNDFKRSYTNGDYPNLYVLKGYGDTYKQAAIWSSFADHISELSSISFVNLDLTNSVTALTIPSEVVLTVTSTLTNPDASKLVIEDGGQLVCNNNPSVTFKKSIDGWGTTPWYFIASPVDGNINPVDVTNLINTETPANYDLYRFNQDPSLDANGSPLVWENYKNESHTDFVLENGKGYLYANASGADLSFSGTINPGTSNRHSVDLDYSDDAPDQTQGWNLVGNPFTCNATVNRAFYKISGNRANASASGAIAPGSGVMVLATDEDRTVTFTKAPNQTPSASTGNGDIQLMLSQTVNHRGTNATETLDNAIVSFNEGSELSKFYFGTQNANIYIPQNGKEFAIVSAGNQNMVPVNFKAHVDGQYTLTFSSPQTSALTSLHLIDNLTGANVDLLQTPSYTFQGRTSDIAARFRLLFTTTGVDENDDQNENHKEFAFVSDGQLIVNGTGTLYVYDALGRQISVEQLSTVNYLSTANYPAGLYLLQLVDGNSVRTQKIIVK